jgi:hypothetical protein
MISGPATQVDDLLWTPATMMLDQVDQEIDLRVDVSSEDHIIVDSVSIEIVDVGHVVSSTLFS